MITLEERPPDACPFLHAVTADSLWLYASGVFCHRPHERVRVPARRTLLSTCMTLRYRDCAGFQESERVGDS